MGGFWPNLHIHIIGKGERIFWILVTLTSFSRSQQHFELSKFDQKSLSASYLLNQMTDSGQTSYIVTLGWFKDLVRFWWPWPNLQGHHTIKTVKMSLVCTLYPEPNGGFWPNLYRNTEMIRFWCPWHHFQGHNSSPFTVKFWPKKLVCTISLEPNDGFWPDFMYCITGIIKRID